MNTLVKYGCSALCLSLALNAQAAAFDCTRATQKVEKMICSDSELSALDSDLYPIYQSAGEATGNSDAFKANAKAAIKWRNRNCTTINCIRSWYEYRKIELQRIAATGFVAPVECVVDHRHISVKGHIVKKTFAGPPNYESIENGDKPLTYWILQTEKPICTYHDNMEKEELEEIAKQTEFQLSIDDYQKYQHKMDKSATVIGIPFTGFSGYHNTPLIIEVIDIK